MQKIKEGGPLIRLLQVTNFAQPTVTYILRHCTSSNLTYTTYNKYLKNRVFMFEMYNRLYGMLVVISNTLHFRIVAILQIHVHEIFYY